MNLVSMLITDFFDLDALEPDRRIIARALLEFYVVGAALTFGLLLWAQVFLMDEPHHMARMVSRWGWLGMLIVVSLLTRRGHVKSSSAVISVALVLMLISDMWRAGGLTIFSSAAIMPLLLLTFLDARRAILIVGTLITCVMCGVQFGLDELNMQGDYLYNNAGAITSFGITMCGAMWVTFLSAHVTGENMAHVEHRTRELEEARARERVRRVEAEEIRRISELSGQAKSRFLANMSHELRTPLSAILGYAEMLAEDIEELDDLGDMYMDDAMRIQHSAHHLLCLINDILDLSRIEAFKMPVVCERLACGVLLEMVEEACAAYCQGTPVIEVSQEDAARVLFMDRTCTVQLIVQAVLEHGVLGTLHCEHDTQDDVMVLRFDASSKEVSPVTDSLLELRALLREALIELLDVDFAAHERGWSLRIRSESP